MSLPSEQDAVIRRSAAVKHFSPASLTPRQAGAQTSVRIINESIICHTSARPAGARGELRRRAGRGGGWRGWGVYAKGCGSPTGFWHAATAIALSLVTDMQCVSAAGQRVCKYNSTQAKNFYKHIIYKDFGGGGEAGTHYCTVVILHHLKQSGSGFNCAPYRGFFVLAGKIQMGTKQTDNLRQLAFG